MHFASKRVRDSKADLGHGIAICQNPGDHYLIPFNPKPSKVDEKFKYTQKMKLPKYQNKAQEQFKEIPLDEWIKKM